ncbi:hypothetical protein RB195_004284 [Necator americanus]|uniref:C6 domain-containing protein n=1 Tax=Necator americanus TaxID=51031 RepID=A0ABR1BL78_NECAM
MVSRLVVLFLTILPLSQACVPTQVITTTTTTTIPCCPMLAQSSLPKRNPSTTDYEQCSVLRRLSSTCPQDGIVFCDAADDTNPARMQVEFFDTTGKVIRTVTNTGRTLAVNVYCKKGVWTVSSTSDQSSATFLPISSVSCAQTGSIGADKGYIIGQAIN